MPSVNLLDDPEVESNIGSNDIGLTRLSSGIGIPSAHSPDYSGTGSNNSSIAHGSSNLHGMDIEVVVPRTNGISSTILKSLRSSNGRSGIPIPTRKPLVGASSSALEPQKLFPVPAFPCSETRNMETQEEDSNPAS